MGENQVQQGLYSQSFEHDNCGIGAVVNIKGRKDHQIVADALKIVEQLEHRAGKDAEGKTGDGVGILTQISLWSINLRIMGGKSNLPLLKVKTLISGLAASFGMTQAQASMIVGIVLAVAAILFLYWFFGTEIGSAMRATGNNEDMVRALGVDTRMTKLLSLMVSNGLVALSGALVCQSQKYGDVGSGTGAIVIGLAAIVIGEVLMGRLTSFYWKLTFVVVGSVIYFVIRAVVLRMGMDANDMKLLSAVIVALALCVPVALAKYRLRKDYSEGGEE